MDKEMQKALKADAEKLEGLLGIPQDVWVTCENCCGDGEILKAAPQRDDPEYCYVLQCPECGGSGWKCL